MHRRDAVVVVLVALLVAPVAGHVAFSLLPGFGSFVVAGTSMEPTIDRGAIIYVHESGRYDPGDVITFQQDDRIVTHRIVSRTTNGYTTQGDANERTDDWRVVEERVVGEVLFVVPRYGYLVAIVGSSTGFAAFVLAPGLVLLALEVRHLLVRVRG